MVPFTFYGVRVRRMNFCTEWECFLFGSCSMVLRLYPWPFAEQYVEAFSNLAKKINTLLLLEKTGDVGSMVVWLAHH